VRGCRRKLVILVFSGPCELPGAALTETVAAHFPAGTSVEDRHNPIDRIRRRHNPLLSIYLEAKPSCILRPSLVLANLTKLVMKQTQGRAYQRRKFELSLISNALNISTFRGGLERALTTVC
jgi:hypothetical protein